MFAGTKISREIVFCDASFEAPYGLCVAHALRFVSAMNSTPSNASGAPLVFTDPEFQASSNFNGAIAGYVFRTGVHGVGYYFDIPPQPHPSTLPPQGPPAAPLPPPQSLLLPQPPVHMSGPVAPPPMPQASLLSAFTTAPVWYGLQGAAPNHDGDEELVKQAWERSRKAAKDAQELSCEVRVLQTREENLRLATPATDPGLGLAKGQQFLMLPHETLPYLLCEAYRVAKGNDPLSVPNPSEMFELATWCCKGGYADDNKLRELVEGGALRPASLRPRMLSGWRFPDGGVAVSFTMVSAAERDPVKLACDRAHAHFLPPTVVYALRMDPRFRKMLADELIDAQSEEEAERCVELGAILDAATGLGDTASGAQTVKWASEVKRFATPHAGMQKKGRPWVPTSAWSPGQALRGWTPSMMPEGNVPMPSNCLYPGGTGSRVVFGVPFDYHRPAMDDAARRSQNAAYTPFLASHKQFDEMDIADLVLALDLMEANSETLWLDAVRARDAASPAR